MKILKILIVILFFSFYDIFAQPSYPIEIKKTFNGYQFYQGPIKLKMKQVVGYMRPYEQAYQQIKKARSSKRFSSILNGTGGVFIAAVLGDFVRGDPNWYIASIGAGLVLIAIPVQKKYKERTLKAIDSYHYALQAESSSFWRRSELEFQLNGNQVSILIRF